MMSTTDYMYYEAVIRNISKNRIITSDIFKTKNKAYDWFNNYVDHREDGCLYCLVLYDSNSATPEVDMPQRYAL